MDRAKLEELIARLARGVSRRETVRGLVGGALASAGMLAEAAAKKKGKGRGKGNGKGKKRPSGKGGGKGKDRNRGKHRGGDSGRAKAQEAQVGAEAKAKGQTNKRCKKNGRNCRVASLNADDPSY